MSYKTEHSGNSGVKRPLTLPSPPQSRWRGESGPPLTAAISPMIDKCCQLSSITVERGQESLPRPRLCGGEGWGEGDRLLSQPTSRSGTTILEVLFATGIVIVGLIGIASILPVAIRNSTQSNTSAEGLSLGLAWADSFLVRGLHQPRPANSDPALRWVWYRDYGGRNVSLGWENALHDFPFGSSTDTDVNRRIWGTPSSSSRIAPSGSSNATSTTKVGRIWGRLPVCIDPYFMTSNTTVGRMIAATGGNTQAIRPGGYRAAVFPYYDDGFNPLVNPLSASQPTTPIDQPRMLRVSLAFGQQAPTSLPPAGPPPSGHLASRQLIQNLFSSVDDLVGDTYQDADADVVERTSPIAKRLFSTIPDAGGNERPLRSLTHGNYTWLATVVPEEPIPSQINTAATTAADNALVSLVVLNRHSHEFVPVDFNGQLLANNEIEENLDGERLTWVIPLSGNFVGGAGGRVRLVASDAVKSNVSVGDWIMLGRYFAKDNSGVLFPFFRWYRIIGVDAEPKVGSMQEAQYVSQVFPYGLDPFSSAASGQNLVWARDLVLEGPDFAFAETVTDPPHDLPAWHPSSSRVFRPLPSPTMGTLVSGVVMVVERQVKLQ